MIRTNRESVFKIILDHIESENFACVGAKTAVALNSLVHFDCENMKLKHAYSALENFTLNGQELSANNSTFVMTFSQERFNTGEQFEKFLWEILSELNLIDYEKIINGVIVAIKISHLQTSLFLLRNTPILS